MMGNRYILEVTCVECGFTDDSAWYAPTSGVRWWICPQCGNKIDLEECSGIMYEEASNQDVIEKAVGGMVSERQTISSNSTWWPLDVMDEIQKVMMEGAARYPDQQWLAQSVEHHVNRASDHLRRFGHDDEEDHLAHAFVRLMMACAIERGYAGINTDADAGVNT